jgi:hypothetical protein
MTILEAIEEANTAAGITGCDYANLKEFQSYVDKSGFNEYPINIVLPVPISGSYSTETFNAKSVVVITGFILRRIAEDTNDWRSVSIETTYMEGIRDFFMTYLAKIADTEIVDKEVQTIRYSNNPEYAFLNNHLFGIRYTINLPVVQNVC